MKITKIVLYNVGPYVDRNVFDCNSDKRKNIVLIGGKNGAGKTTFFKSIKTCLYGCKVWGFDAEGKEYYKIIDSLINMKMQYDNSVKAYIEIELLFDDGKQKIIYTLHREWMKQKKNIEERFFVYKYGAIISAEEQADFTNYLLSIIPPDMFNFYFFDGESIADFFLGNDGGKNFKNAFLKLYGLDTLSLMVENFERFFRKRDGKNQVFENYQTLKNQLDIAEKELLNLFDEKKQIEDKIDLLNIKVKAHQDEYSKSGGIGLGEWKQINTDLTKEEARRDEINRWLKEIANHYLPFFLLEKELLTLKSRLEEQQENQKFRLVKDVLLDEKFQVKLSDYFLNSGDSNIDVKNLVEFICQNTFKDDESSDLFDFSINQSSKLISQIYEKIDFDKEQVIKALNELTSSLKKSKKLRDRLSSSTIEGFEDFTNKKECLEKEILDFTLKLERVNQNLELKEDEVSVLRTTFEKAKTEYEKYLRTKSINEISARAVSVYSKLEEKLIKRQSDILEKEFMNCFSSIINKENFLDGIVIDKNINIIPYKYVDVSFLQIDNYLKKNESNDFLSLFDKKLWLNINNLRLGYVESIKLPSPITAPFSQGERQVYIMSIYLALLKTSRKDIPFFIDTPFARIDSKHRTSIVKEFFKKVSNQMFILSTDEEIVGEYKLLIEDNISNTYMLQINGYGNTNIVSDKYFGE